MRARWAAGRRVRDDGRLGTGSKGLARAIDLGEKARKANPRDPAVQRILAGYYARMGKTLLAGQRIETALALAPNSPEVQAGGAEVYELLGQRKKALTLAKRSMELGYTRRRLEQYPELAGLLKELK